MKQAISGLSPFPWAPASGLTYLDIQLVVPSTNLVRFNFEKLIKKLQDLCLSLRSIKASWAGKIALAKIFFMPHILYLFQNHPYYISAKPT